MPSKEVQSTDIIVAVDGQADYGKLAETLAAVDERANLRVRGLKIGLTCLVIGQETGALTFCDNNSYSAISDLNKPTDPSLNYGQLIKAISENGYDTMVASPTVGPNILSSILEGAAESDLEVVLALDPPRGKGFWRDEGGNVSKYMPTKTSRHLGLKDARHSEITDVVSTPKNLTVVRGLVHPETGIWIPGANKESDIRLATGDSLVIGRAILNARSPEAAAEETSALVDALTTAK